MKTISIIVLAMTTAFCALAQPPAVAFYFMKTEAEFLALAEVELDKVPFLTDADILSYCWANHSMALATNAIAKLPSTRDVGTGGKAFVIVVNGERCYRGAFWCSASSIAHFNPVILTDHYDAKSVVIYRMYPTFDGRGPLEVIADGKKSIVPDPRDDDRLREAFRRLGKLVEEKTPSKAPEATR